MKNFPPDAGKLDGSRTIAELVVTEANGVPAVAMGKAAILDIGARMRQIAGLKPGSSSIRTAAMDDEIIDRLRSGEALTSIHCDVHMPSTGALWNWREKDPDFDKKIREAQAQGAHFLRDATLDIAHGGVFSSGDARRDELIIKTIEKNIAQRNRKDFGDKVQMDVNTGFNISLPPIAIPITDIRVQDSRDDGADDLAE